MGWAFASVSIYTHTQWDFHVAADVKHSLREQYTTQRNTSSWFLQTSFQFIALPVLAGVSGVLHIRCNTKISPCKSYHLFFSRMEKNISSKPQSRNAPDRYLYFDLPCPPSLMEIWSLWSASRPTIARPTSEHLTPLQHSNTPTLQHGDTCKLGPVICWNLAAETIHSLGGRSRTGGKISVTLRRFYIHILHGQNVE